MTAPITSHPFEPCEHDYSDIVGLCDVWVSTTKRCGQPESAHAAPEPAPDLNRAVIHHMTLMLEEYGRHDPACVCSGDQVVHSADCKDCDCGLLSAMEFGIEHGGPIEPEPMTAEEEAHLNEIAKQAVEKVLSEARVSAGLAPKDALSYVALRSANVRRCEEVFHKLHDWSPTDWACAFAGEAGEACNVVKKLRRLDGADATQDTPEKRAEVIRAIAEEIADAVIYADLLAARLDIDLGEAVREKFNTVSRKRGSTVFL